MSDRNLRELEVAWKQSPTRETVRAYANARQRAEPPEPLPKKERFLVVFDPQGVMEENDSLTKMAEEGHGRREGYSYRDNAVFVAGIYLEVLSKSYHTRDPRARFTTHDGESVSMLLADFNESLDLLRGRWIVGRFKFRRHRQQCSVVWVGE